MVTNSYDNLPLVGTLESKTSNSANFLGGKPLIPETKVGKLLSFMQFISKFSLKNPHIPVVVPLLDHHF